MKRWVTAALCAGIMLGVGWLHPLLLILPMLLLPLMSAVLAANGTRAAVPVLAAGLFAAACVRWPSAALPAAGVLCAGSALLAVTEGSDSRRRGLNRCALCLAALAAAAVTAFTLYAGTGLDIAIAERLTELLRQDKNCGTILVKLCSNGLLTLTAESPIGIRLGSLTLLLPSVQNELLLMVRERLAEYARIILVELCGAWPVLSGLLAASASDGIGYARARLRDLPEFAVWQPGRWLRLLICLGVCFLCLPGYQPDGWLSVTAMTLGAALTAVCCVFGTSVLCGLMGRERKGRFVLACVLGALLSAVAPSLMQLLVVADDLFDFRGIRPEVPEDPE